MRLVDYHSNMPSRKVIASSVGTAVGAAASYFLTVFAAYHWALTPLLYPEVQGPIVLAVSTATTFVFGYLFRERVGGSVELEIP